MDPITHISIKKDTSFAMLLEAQKRGYSIFYMEMSDLYLDNGKAMARMRPLSVKEDPQNWFELGEEHFTPMGELDAILMRKDPPFDSEYLYATQLFELAEQQGGG